MTAPQSGERSDRGESHPHPVGAGLFAALQHLLPQHALSAAVHRLARVRRGPVRTALLSAFVRGFKPQMQDATESNPWAYESFNALFTRSLKPGARPIDPDPRSIVSPVDGTVSQIGELDGLTLIQAKGRTYPLDALLSDDVSARDLAGGSFATLYLAPSNYHRIHMPAGARLAAAWYVPGRLFSVNAATASAVKDLFARNERVVCLFETAGRGSAGFEAAARDSGSDAARGPSFDAAGGSGFEAAPGPSFAMVLVGALFVGSITTRWHGEVTPRSPRDALELPVRADAPSLDKGAEMGRFNMGSTVILIFPRGTVSWAPQLGPGSRIVVGQRLGHLADRT